VLRVAKALTSRTSIAGCVQKRARSEKPEDMKRRSRIPSPFPPTMPCDSMDAQTDEAKV
jgi:hypothetical protein